MLSNRSSIIFGRILMLSLLGIIAVDFAFSNLTGSLGNYFEQHIPAIIAASAAGILLLLNPYYFSFFDDHEIIQIKSGSCFWPFFEHKADVNFNIPKKNIRGFNISVIRSGKELHLELHTKYRGEETYDFPMSFFGRHATRQIEKSLQQATALKKESRSAPSLTAV